MGRRFLAMLLMAVSLAALGSAWRQDTSAEERQLEALAALQRREGRQPDMDSENEPEEASDEEVARHQRAFRNWINRDLGLPEETEGEDDDDRERRSASSYCPSCRAARGPPGQRGPPGPPGSRGPPGPAGRGPKGATGARGPRGYPGAIGSGGPIGPTGKTGETGPKGEAGIPGKHGRNGAKGEKGERGDTGRKGDVGPPGKTTITKVQGPVGPPGLQGKTGPRGLSGRQGQKGDTGEPGPYGAQGNTGPQGPKGNQGPPGAPGQKGSVGSPGPVGPQGESCNTTTTATATPRIAFSCYSYKIQINKPVRFNSCSYNLGNAVNIRESHIISPVSGYYHVLFSATPLGKTASGIITVLKYKGTGPELPDKTISYEDQDATGNPVIMHFIVGLEENDHLFFRGSGVKFSKFQVTGHLLFQGFKREAAATVPPPKPEGDFWDEKGFWDDRDFY